MRGRGLGRKVQRITPMVAKPVGRVGIGVSSSRSVRTMDVLGPIVETVGQAATGALTPQPRVTAMSITMDERRDMAQLLQRAIPSSIREIGASYSSMSTCANLS
jgi:hypothetical protein